MDNLFVPVDPQDEPDLKLMAEKFGDGENIDVKKLASGKLNADRHIQTLERELAELRQKATQQLTLQEIMTQIKQTAPRQEVASDQQPPVTPPAPQPSIDSESVKSVFEQLLEQKEAEKKKQTNKQVVHETLVSRLGAQAPSYLNDKARELGVSLEYLAKLSEENPKVFFRTIDLEDKPAPAAPVVAPRGTVAQTPSTNSVVRDNAYWARVKKDNPTYYFSSEARRLRYNDGMAGHYQP